MGLFTADKWGHVCPTIRVEEPLRMAGIQVLRGNTWFGNKLLVDDKVIDEVELVIIQRDFPGYYEDYRKVVEKTKKTGKPIVYEIDDLLLDVPDFHPDINRYKPIRYRILEAIITSDAIICSNPELRSHLQKFSDDVYVLPNYIIPEIWDLKRPLKIEKNECPVKITFMGSSSHITDLEMIQTVLYKINQKYASTVEFSFWGCKPPSALEKSRNSLYIDVALHDYRDFVKWFLSQKSDLFIAPLVDCPFNRSKSYLKYLEYSMLGVPGVYSNLPPYSQLIENGVNGFLAASLDEWEYYIRELIENPVLRYNVGTSALNNVKDNYVLTEKRAREWQNILYDILQKCKFNQPEIKIINAIDLVEYWYKQDEKILQNEKNKSTETIKLIESKDIEIKNIEAQLHSIRSSLTWKILEILSSIRYKIFPQGSISDKFFFKIKNFLRSGRKYKSSSKRVKRNQTFQIIPISEESENMITVLIPVNYKIPFPDINLVRKWLSKQTVVSDLALWNQKCGTLEWYGPEKKITENINSWKDVKKLLRTKYVVIGYFDILSMPPTFLETNLIALESEHLNFVINQLGYTNLFPEKLANGLFPGNFEMPLFRMVFSKDIIEDITNTQTKLFVSTFQGVGKLIVQPVNIPDTEANVPFSFLSQDRFEFEPNSRCIYVPEINNDIFKDFYTNNYVIKIPSQIKKKEQPVVLMVHPFLALGGAERIALNLMNSLQDDFVFVVTTHELHKPELGNTIDEFRQVTPFVYTFPDFIEQSKYLKFMDYLIMKFKVDILYIANGSIWIYDNLLAISKMYPNVKIVNQVYDHEAGWINWYSRDLVRAVNAHIASNKKIINAYKEKGVSSDSIHYIENGVNTVFYSPEFYNAEKLIDIKTRLGVPLDSKVVTFIGRIHPQKRPLDFVELSRRANLKGLNYFFLMVGDGVLSESVDGEIMTKELKNIHHRTFYSPSRDIFAISDVIVLTSEYEGMPMVVLESISMGVPVVSTDVGNVKEVLLATGGGIAEAEPGQIDKLLEGIQKVIENPPDNEKLRQLVTQKYSLEVMAEKYKKAFLAHT